jgi:fucose permease
MIRHREAGVISTIFACSGLVFGSWASFIPYIKEKLLLDEAQLGLLLLSMPLGVLVVNSVSIVLIRRFGALMIAMTFASLTGIAFLIPVTVWEVPLIATGLFLCGASFGITNVSMNTYASALEKSIGIRFISACHGMWSIGAMSGALLSGFSLLPLRSCCGHLMDPQKLYMLMQALAVSLLILLLRLSVRKIASAHPQVSPPSRINWSSIKPGGELWFIILICLCTYLVEGTVTDWSAVFLRDELQTTKAIAGQGYAVYAFFMASGRFIGDWLIARFGNMPVLRVGGYLSFAGWIIIISSSSYLFAIPGFALIGAGISLASPILYQAAANVEGLAAGVGLATMNTIAMTAFLCGPVIIGVIAEKFTLRLSLVLVLLATIIWIIQASSMIRKGFVTHDALHNGR